MDKSAEAAGMAADWRAKRDLLIDDFPSMRARLRDILRNLGIRFAVQGGRGA